jgi:hypothetical protein
MREKIGKQMLQTSVRKIEYDFMACTGKLFQDFGYCDMSECIAYFEKIDPAVIRIQTYCGGEKDILFSVGWQMTGHELFSRARTEMTNDLLPDACAAARRAGRPRSKIIAHAEPAIRRRVRPSPGANGSVVCGRRQPTRRPA